MESTSSSSNISNGDSSAAKQWKAEDAIGGNTEALQALRELIIFPLHYSREAQKLGLKVKLLPFSFCLFPCCPILIWFFPYKSCISFSLLYYGLYTDYVDSVVLNRKSYIFG